MSDISLTIILSESSIHVVSKGRISFFLISDYCFIVCIYHIFFIIHHFDRHLDCYHTLAIVNNAIINKQVQVSFWYPAFIFFGCIPRSGLCRSYGSFIFNFLRDFHTIFLVAEAIYISTDSAQAFLFLQILTNTCLLLSFWWQPFWLMWSALWSWFWFTFPWKLTVLSIFSCTCWSVVYLLWTMSVQFLCPFFNWTVYFLLLSCMISLYILDINHFSDTLLYISYIGCIVFCCSFCCAEAF